jgi:DNA-binding LytR/AlgR family response regulator
MKFTCIAIDDNAGALKQVQKAIQQSSELRLLSKFTQPQKACDYLLQHKPDILFVDIDMPRLSGWAIIRAIKDGNLHTRVIITTSHIEYGKDGFDYKVDDFLLKPFSQERFDEAVEAAKVKLLTYHIEGLNRDNGLLQEVKFKDKDSGIVEKIPLAQIDSFAVAGNSTRIFAGNKIITVLESLTRLLQELPRKYFVRVNYNQAIAVFKIEKYTGSKVWLVNKTVFEISRAYKNGVDELLRG